MRDKNKETLIPGRVPYLLGEKKAKDNALKTAFRYGNYDGSHHKEWCIDQIVRALCGDEESYDAWVKKFNDGEEGPNTYEWRTGIAP